jgi:hypothetical protein
MMQPATGSTNQPNRSDSSAIKPENADGLPPAVACRRSSAFSADHPSPGSAGLPGARSTRTRAPVAFAATRARSNSDLACLATIASPPSRTSSVVSPRATRFHRPLRELELGARGHRGQIPPARGLPEVPEPLSNPTPIRSSSRLCRGGPCLGARSPADTQGATRAGALCARGSPAHSARRPEPRMSRSRCPR